MIQKPQAFFADAPTILMRDALGQFLGATQDGLIEYGYEDAVALAGHSCPTVAVSWLMTRAALRHLYGDSVPERGGVSVAWRDARTSGVTGVMANVVGLVTGACDESGFKGLGGRFQRSGLLSFGVPMEGEIRFTRLDSGASIETSSNPSKVPMPGEVRMLMSRCLSEQASPAEFRAFGEAWQTRVRKLLLEYADDPEVIILHTK
ncbi:Conserved hypothetical protein [gamma proteobacterium HdN1]|nr:Conserved hypothetical protein [gamma proteobacterium HdN1]